MTASGFAPDLSDIDLAGEWERARTAVLDSGGSGRRAWEPGKAGFAPQVPEGARVASAIDHTLLKPGSTADQIAKLCAEALEFGFAAVCVNSGEVSRAAGLLSGSPVKVASTVGFPLGACIAESKAFEAGRVVAAGASEVDTVIDLGGLKSGDYRRVARDLLGVVRAAHAGGAIVKVIIEAGMLTRSEKVAACLLAAEAGAEFVKTSTGFSAGGATVEDVALMRGLVGPHLGVKASGGIRALAEARAMLAAGATRLGTSSGVAIVREALGEKGGPGGTAGGY